MTAVNSNAFGISIVGESALGRVVAGLGPGESSVELGNTWSGDVPGSVALNWTNKLFYDESRRLLWGMIQQHGGMAVYHFELNESTNDVSCARCDASPFRMAGHTYDIPSYDRATGNRYYANGANSNEIMRWTPGSPLSSWTVVSAPATQDFGTEAPLASDGTFADNSAFAMCWHPNLFGAGRGGLVIVCRKGVAAYDPAMGTAAGAFSAIVPQSAWGTGVSNATAVYVAAIDAVLVSNNANGPEVYRIDSATSYAELAAPPIGVSVDSGGDNVAKIWEGPDGTTAYLFELNGGGRVWTFNDATGAFDVVDGVVHPFESPVSSEDFMGSGLHSYGAGAFIAAERDGGAPYVRFRVARL